MNEEPLRLIPSEWRDKAIAELREEEGRYHPEAVAGLERLLPELEIVSAYL